LEHLDHGVGVLGGDGDLGGVTDLGGAIDHGGDLDLGVGDLGGNRINYKCHYVIVAFFIYLIIIWTRNG